MTHIKKWILMLVLAITIVLTTNPVYAQSYVADDNYVMPSQYHDLFNNYFNGDNSYQYFSYSCNYGSYERHCYYGIDSENNYLKVDYTSSSNNYESQITTGIDEDFSVSGKNIFSKGVSREEITNNIFVFGLCLFVFLTLLEVIK